MWNAAVDLRSPICCNALSLHSSLSTMGSSRRQKETRLKFTNQGTARHRGFRRKIYRRDIISSISIHLNATNDPKIMKLFRNCIWREFDGRSPNSRAPNPKCKIWQIAMRHNDKRPRNIRNTNYAIIEWSYG